MTLGSSVIHSEILPDNFQVFPWHICKCDSGENKTQDLGADECVFVYVCSGYWNRSG